MSMEVNACCPQCGFEAPAFAMRAEESLTGVDDNVVMFASRVFEAKCPTHGTFLLNSAGHHATISKKRLADQFSKLDKIRLREMLSGDERKIFDQTCRGKRIPKDGEVERRRALLNAE